MTIKACSKCRRINTGNGWSPNPSSQLDPKRKDVLWCEGCPLCLGETQCEEPPDGAQGAEPDTDGHARATPEAPAQGSAEPEEPGGRGLAPDGDRAAAEGAPGAGSAQPAGRRRKGRLEREAERREAKAQTDCAANLAERPQEVKPLMPGADMDEKLGVVANEHHQALVQCRKLMGQALLEFCSHLRTIRDQDLWKFYSESWNEYLAMPEVDIDASRSRRLIQLVETKEKLEKQLGHPVDIEGIPEYRLTRGLLPCLEIDRETGEIKNVEVAEEIIAKARTLGGNDWAAEVEEKKSAGGGGGPRPIPELLLQANSNLLNAEGEIVGVVVTARADENNHTLKIKISNGYITDDLVIRFQ